MKIVRELRQKSLLLHDIDLAMVVDPNMPIADDEHIEERRHELYERLKSEMRESITPEGAAKIDMLTSAAKSLQESSTSKAGARKESREQYQQSTDEDFRTLISRGNSRISQGELHPFMRPRRTVSKKSTEPSTGDVEVHTSPSRGHSFRRSRSSSVSDSSEHGMPGRSRENSKTLSTSPSGDVNAHTSSPNNMRESRSSATSIPSEQQHPDPT